MLQRTEHESQIRVLEKVNELKETQEKDFKPYSEKQKN